MLNAWLLKYRKIPRFGGVAVAYTMAIRIYAYSEPALMIVSLTSSTLYGADGSDFSNFTGTVLATSAAADWNTDDQTIVLGDSGFYRVVVQNNVVPMDGFYYTNGKYGTYIAAAIMPRTRHNSTVASSYLPHTHQFKKKHCNYQSVARCWAWFFLGFASNRA